MVANSHWCFEQHQHAAPRSRALPAPLRSTPPYQQPPTWLMPPLCLPSASATEKPAMAVEMVPSVVAMASHDKKVRSLAAAGAGGGGKG